MADLNWAIFQLRWGEKVRRRCWNKSSFLRLNDNNKIVSDEGILVDFSDIRSFGKTDYELFEDETLSEGDLDYEEIKDLKQGAIKELKELQNAPASIKSKILKEIIGTYPEEPVIKYIKWKFNITEKDLR